MHTFLGHPVKIFRSDQEKGYTSKYVTDYCKSTGTKCETTIADSHKQLGMNEGYHAHCLDSVRTMITQAQLGPESWGEAVMNYSYTRNKLPTTGRKYSPDTIWYERTMDIKHLRAFGEIGFARIMPKDQGSKIAPRAYAAHFVGYDLKTKGYRMYDPLTSSIFLSRDVQFLPNNEWPKIIELSRFGELDKTLPIKIPQSPNELLLKTTNNQIESDTEDDEFFAIPRVQEHQSDHNPSSDESEPKDDTQDDLSESDQESSDDENPVMPNLPTKQNTIPGSFPNPISIERRETRSMTKNKILISRAKISLI
jgi:hypothetical protein